MANKRMRELFKFSVTTSTILSPIVTIIQGKPKLKSMSKILVPIALEMVIPPLFCLAIIINEIRLGILVPAAKIVRPIITAGVPSISAEKKVLSTKIQLRAAIKVIETKKTKPVFFIISKNEV